MRYSPNNRGSYVYNMWGSQGYRRYNNNINNRRGNYRNQNYNRDRSRSFERLIRNRRDGRRASNSRSRSGSRTSTNRDRIWCFECRQYNHFTWECPTKQARQSSRETKQIQQMFNMDKNQTLIQTSLMDTDKDELTITPTDTRGNLNL